MRIANNISAVVAQGKLRAAQSKIAKHAESLSSGFRINRSADDAAGLAISEKMRAQIRGLKQASRNVQDGISLVQVADKGLGDILEFPLQRIRELVIQAANDTLTYEDRLVVQEEIDQLKESIDNIAQATNFNRINLLDGSNPFIHIIDKPEYDYANVLSSNPVTPEGKFSFRTNQGYPTTTADNDQILVYGNGSTSIPKIIVNGQAYAFQSQPSTSSIENGYYKNTYEILEDITVTQLVGIVKDKYEIKYEINNNSGVDKDIGFQFHIDTMLGNDDHAPFVVNEEIITHEQDWHGSSIPDSFIVYNQNTGEGANAELQAHGILHGEGIIETPDRFGIGRFSDVGDPNWEPSGTVGDSGYSIWWDQRTVGTGQSFAVNTFYGLSVPPTIEDPTSTDDESPYHLLLQVGANSAQNFEVELADVRVSTLGIENLSVLSNSAANAAIGLIDQAMAHVSSARSRFGAYQNALEHISNNVNSSAENLQAAESRIRDLDMAEEIMSFTKETIVSQAGTAMLAQANMASQNVLHLLE